MSEGQPVSDEEEDTGVVRPVSLSHARELRTRERRTEVIALRIAGLSIPQIGQRMGIIHTEVEALLESALKDTPPAATHQLRQVENQRLDRAQAAIWDKVLNGDLNAIDSYLRISQRRAALNGLDAPKQVVLSANVRVEMESALRQLEEVMLHVVEEVIEDDDDDTGAEYERG